MHCGRGLNKIHQVLNVLMVQFFGHRRGVIDGRPKEVVDATGLDLTLGRRLLNPEPWVSNDCVGEPGCTLDDWLIRLAA